MDLFTWLIDHRDVLEDVVPSLEAPHNPVDGALAVLMVGTLCPHGAKHCLDAAVRFLQSEIPSDVAVAPQSWEYVAAMLAHAGSEAALHVPNVSTGVYALCFGLLNGASDKHLDSFVSKEWKYIILRSVNVLLPLRVSASGSSFEFFAASTPQDYYELLMSNKQAYNLLGNPVCASVVRSDGHLADICGVRLLRREGFAPKPDTHAQPFVFTETTTHNMHNLASALSISRVAPSEMPPVLISGPPGCGKSKAILWLAGQLGFDSDLIELHLDESMDAKLLIGGYSCTDTPGEFTWQPGVVTQAVQLGRWLLIEDIERASFEVLSGLTSLMESRSLCIPSRGVIQAHPGFQLIATRTSTSASLSGPFAAFAHKWLHVQFTPLADLASKDDTMPNEELIQIISGIFPTAPPSILEAMRQLYTVLECCFGQRSVQLFSQIVRTETRDLSKYGRTITARALVKVAKRLEHAQLFARYHSSVGHSMLLDAERFALVSHFFSVSAAHIPNSTARAALIKTLAAAVGLDADVSYGQLFEHCPSWEVTGTQLCIGRARIQCVNASTLQRVIPKSLAPARKSLRLLEQLAFCVSESEPVLLVGGTGNGKTHIIQALAGGCGNKLVVINLNVQSDSGDLIGGYKPLHLKQLAAPLLSALMDAFVMTFSKDGNSQFLSMLQTSVAQQDWRRFVRGARKMVAEGIRRGSHDLHAAWNGLSAQLDQFGHQIDTSERSPSRRMAFSFVEGALVEAIRKGFWVLLDEINLASPDVLRRLSGLLEEENASISLTERGDADIIRPHHNFRLFAAMNPATDVGKRDLPPALRSRFTEFFVDDMDDRTDLCLLVEHFLSHTDIALDSSFVQTIVDLFLEARRRTRSESGDLRDGAGFRPHYSIRTLTRALKIGCDLLVRGFGASSAIAHGFLLSFVVQLDRPSAAAVAALIESAFKVSLSTTGVTTSGKMSSGKRRREARSEVPTDGQILVGDVQLPAGPLVPFDDTTRRPDGSVGYVRVPSVERHLVNIARAIACGRYPVLLQGPTSSGKTSMVEYLAKLCGYTCVRINNHEHTDISEYIGTYVSDAGGNLCFADGALVTALRNGYWIILDELNLAPSEVLEALNRLLDDNRELFIPETQEVVRPHPNFMLFATQNPPGLYGGRKQLSEAFRNRFIEMHIEDIPDLELEKIIADRSQLPTAFISCMVNVSAQLHKLRQSSNVFAGKHGFITTRDLLKWAHRQPDCYASLARQGFFVLGEKLRSEAERAVVESAISQQCKYALSAECMYDPSTWESGTEADGAQVLPVSKRPRLGSESRAACMSMAKADARVWLDSALDVTRESLSNQIEQTASLPGTEGLTTITLTTSLRRLYVLVRECILNDEPVLLVGDTGCGKTTVLQFFALMCNIPLRIVNCHANSETADFLGSMRPARQKQTHVRAGLDACSSVVSYLQAQSSIHDEIRKLVEKLSELGQREARVLDDEIAALKVIKAALSGMLDADEVLPRLIQVAETEAAAANAVFEWVHGPLVQAMRDGDFFLLDECSLAEDAVLERLNSVLEPSRTLTLAEKGELSTSAEASVVRASKSFRFFATMNPGGDFGKRELSPAFRNRFTEIWVPTVTDPHDLLAVIQEKAVHILQRSSGMKTALPAHIVGVTGVITDFCCWFDRHCGSGRFIAEPADDVHSKRKVLFLTLRDIHSWIDFIVTMTQGSTSMHFWDAFAHGLRLVLLDGLGLGMGLPHTVAAALCDATAEYIISNVPREAHARIHRILSNGIGDHLEVVYPDERNSMFGVPPFTLSVDATMATGKNSALFLFDTATVRHNLFRVLRAMQLTRPILLEGSPGVGKSSLVAALSSAVHRPLIRINLSEQTDLADLFGQDVPDITNPGRFTWVDGPFLEAMREGKWVLLDELNLASQSVLEGLNACLDHRSSAFIPELGRSFPCKSTFRVFATQNPIGEGGGRKGLPKSFLNRFTKVYMSTLDIDDQKHILDSAHPQLTEVQLGRTTVLGFVAAVQTAVADAARLKELSNIGGPWDFNLRDLTRWLDSFQLCHGNDVVHRLARSFELVYARRFRSAMDRAHMRGIFSGRCAFVGCRLPLNADFIGQTSVYALQDAIVFNSEMSQSRLQASWQRKLVDVPIGTHLLENEIFNATCCKFPVLLVGNAARGKTSLIRRIAEVNGAPFRQVFVTPATDANDLVGCFEQSDSTESHNKLHHCLVEFDKALADALLLAEAHGTKVPTTAIATWINVRASKDVKSDSRDVVGAALTLTEEITRICADNKAVWSSLASCAAMLQTQQHFRHAAAQFSWTDGDLVTAIKRGEWLVVENVNFCSPAVIDRLNALLEPHGSLLVSEGGRADDGTVPRIVPHADFRIFFTMNPSHGEVSRALRNRCVELYVGDDVLLDTDEGACSPEHLARCALADGCLGRILPSIAIENAAKRVPPEWHQIKRFALASQASHICGQHIALPDLEAAPSAALDSLTARRPAATENEPFPFPQFSVMYKEFTLSARVIMRELDITLGEMQRSNTEWEVRVLLTSFILNARVGCTSDIWFRQSLVEGVLRSVSHGRHIADIIRPFLRTGHLSLHTISLPHSEVPPPTFNMLCSLSLAVDQRAVLEAAGLLRQLEFETWLLNVHHSAANLLRACDTAVEDPRVASVTTPVLPILFYLSCVDNSPTKALSPSACLDSISHEWISDMFQAVLDFCHFMAHECNTRGNVDIDRANGYILQLLSVYLDVLLLSSVQLKVRGAGAGHANAHAVPPQGEETTLDHAVGKLVLVWLELCYHVRAMDATLTQDSAWAVVRSRFSRVHASMFSLPLVLDGPYLPLLEDQYRRRSGYPVISRSGLVNGALRQVLSDAGVSEAIPRLASREQYLDLLKLCLDVVHDPHPQEHVVREAVATLKQLCAESSLERTQLPADALLEALRERSVQHADVEWDADAIVEMMETIGIDDNAQPRRLREGMDVVSPVVERLVLREERAVIALASLVVVQLELRPRDKCGHECTTLAEKLCSVAAKVERLWLAATNFPLKDLATLSICRSVVASLQRPDCRVGDVIVRVRETLTPMLVNWTIRAFGVWERTATLYPTCTFMDTFDLQQILCHAFQLLHSQDGLIMSLEKDSAVVAGVASLVTLISQSISESEMEHLESQRLKVLALDFMCCLIPSARAKCVSPDIAALSIRELLHQLLQCPDIRFQLQAYPQLRSYLTRISLDCTGNSESQDAIVLHYLRSVMLTPISPADPCQIASDARYVFRSLSRTETYMKSAREAMQTSNLCRRKASASESFWDARLSTYKAEDCERFALDEGRTASYASVRQTLQEFMHSFLSLDKGLSYLQRPAALESINWFGSVVTFATRCARDFGAFPDVVQPFLSASLDFALDSTKHKTDPYPVGRAISAVYLCFQDDSKFPDDLEMHKLAVSMPMGGRRESYFRRIRSWIDGLSKPPLALKTAASDAEEADEEFRKDIPDFFAIYNAEHTSSSSIKGAAPVAPTGVYRAIAAISSSIKYQGEGHQRDALRRVAYSLIDDTDLSHSLLRGGEGALLDGAMAACGGLRKIVQPTPARSKSDGAISIKSLFSHSLLSDGPNTAAYNFFHDENVGEVSYAVPTLRKFAQRLCQLLGVFPGNGVLTQLLRTVCTTIKLGRNVSVPTVLAGLMMVLQQAQVWEESAPAAASLGPALTGIQHLVTRWRRFELQEWQQALLAVAEQQEERATQEWTAFCQSRTSFQSASDAFRAADTFMRSSTLGQFTSRMQLLRFAAHLRIFDSYSHLLLSVCDFYGQYHATARISLETLATPIWTELQEQITLHRWDEQTYYSLKESLEKGHKILHRGLQQLRCVCDRAVVSVIDHVYHLPRHAITILPYSAVTAVAEPFTPINTEMDMRPYQHLRFLPQVQRLAKRMAQLLGDDSCALSETRIRARFDDTALHELHADILEVVQSVDSHEVKKNMKTKLVVDCYKRLVRSGIDGKLASMRLKIPLLSRSQVFESILAPEADFPHVLLADTESAFMTALDRVLRVKASIEDGKWHEDLPESEAKRLFAQASHLFDATLQQRNALMEFANDLAALRRFALQLSGHSQAALNHEIYAECVEWLDYSRAVLARLFRYYGDVSAVVHDRYPNHGYLFDWEEGTANAAMEASAMSKLFQELSQHAADALNELRGPIQTDEVLRSCLLWLEQQIDSISNKQITLGPASSLVWHLFQNGFQKLSNALIANDGRLGHSYDLPLLWDAALQSMLVSVQTDYGSQSTEGTAEILDVSRDVASYLRGVNIGKVRDSFATLTNAMNSGLATLRVEPILDMLHAYVSRASVVADQCQRQLHALVYCALADAEHVMQLLSSGYRCPQADEEETAGGPGTELTEGTGIGEGVGAKDVTDEIKEEGQIQGLQDNAERKEADGAKQPKADGVEMKDDFDGELQSVSGDDDKSGEEDDEEQQELDRQMGDLEDKDEADNVDSKLWDKDDDTAQKQEKGGQVGADAPSEGIRAAPESDATNDDQKVPPAADEETAAQPDQADQAGSDETNERDGINNDLPDESLTNPEADASEDCAKDSAEEVPDVPENTINTLPADAEQEQDGVPPSDEIDMDGAQDTQPDMPEQGELDLEANSLSGMEIEDGTGSDADADADADADRENAMVGPDDPFKDTLDNEEAPDQHPVDDAAQPTGGIGSAGSEAHAQADDQQTPDEPDRRLPQPEGPAGQQPQHGDAEGGRDKGGAMDAEKEEFSDSTHPQAESQQQPHVNPKDSASSRLHANLKKIQQEMISAARSSAKSDTDADQYKLHDDLLSADAVQVDDEADEEVYLPSAQQAESADAERENGAATADDPAEQAATVSEGPSSTFPESATVPPPSIHDMLSDNVANPFRQHGAMDAGDALIHSRTEDTALQIINDELDLASMGTIDFEALRKQVEDRLTSFFANPHTFVEAMHSWHAITTAVSESATRLCESLRLVLEPTLATKLGGEYKSGKRINMRKIIPYIASEFRKDKIWMRRSVPSKRTYQILLAIDDSKSMAPGNTGAGITACETIALISKALVKLEVGELALAAFGEKFSLLHPFGKPFTDESGAQALSAFSFNQGLTKTSDTLASIVHFLDEARSSAAIAAQRVQCMQLAFLISDGMIGTGVERDKIRRWTTEAASKGQLIVLIIVDKSGHHSEDSIVNMQSVSFKDGKVVKTSYIEDYPFPYYVVVRDVHQLPDVLANALRQWFELLTRL